MTEILSQNEIDGLLLAISQGEVETCDNRSENKKLKIYDFRRPDRFTKEQFRTLQMMHETFTRLSAPMLTTELLQNVSVKIISIDQLTFEEFLRSLPDPTVIGIVNIKPLPFPAVLEIDPPVAFAIIESLFGGGNAEAGSITRELTDIELLQMERLMNGMIPCLRHSWINVIDLKPELSGIETCPQYAQIVPSGEMSVLITIEIKIGPVEGLMNLCYPYLAIEPVIDRLYSKPDIFTGISTSGNDPVGEINAVFRRYNDYSGAVSGMTPDDIRKLKPGMKIDINRESEANAVYEYNGVKKGVQNA